MTDEQIRLYAECRVACPSPMIRLRSTTDKNRLVVVATRREFRMPVKVEPRIIPVKPDLLGGGGLEVEAFQAERAWLAVDRFLFWDHGAVAFKMAAEELAETITRGFRRAYLNVRL